MVLRVCNGVLRDVHSSEDAFQATFLILANQARAIRSRDSVASWLFGVARRVAIRAKADRARRATHEGRLADQPRGDAPASDQAALLREIQDEVDRLPEKYRAPVVLCYLGGVTHEEAAGRLGVPVGTVKVRLHRARERLRGRLVRRGLVPAAALVSLEGLSHAAPMALGDAMVDATARLAASRGAALGPVATLVKGALRAMLLAKLKAAAVLLTTGITVIVASALVVSAFPRRARSAQPARRPADNPVPQPDDQTKTAGKNKTKFSVSSAKKATVQRTTAQVASVHPYDTKSVFSRYAGYVKKLNTDVGDSVQKGQVLAEIDAPELAFDVAKNRALRAQALARLARLKAAEKVAEAAIEVAAAQKESAAAEIVRYEATVRFRQHELARYQDLRKQNAVPESVVAAEEEHMETAKAGVEGAKAALRGAKANLDEAVAKREAARADVAAASPDVEIADLDYKKAQALQEFTTIKAPIMGVVSECNYHVGDFMRSVTEINPKPLLQITRTDKMRAVTYVPDRDAPFLNKGDRARIAIDALDRVYEGVVARTDSRTLRAEIDLDNTDGRLRQGQHGQATIILEERADVLTIPSSALVGESRHGRAVCYRVVDGRAVRTATKTGLDDGSRVEVVEGLTEGDTVVSNPRPGIDGQPVKSSDTEPAKK